MQVKVSGAPGYADFVGELIMTVPRVDGVEMAVVGYDDGEGRGVEIVPACYASEIE